jgi:two-component system NtrC family response regulator
MKQRNLLLIEDEEIQRKEMKIALKEEGFNVDDCENAEEAIDIIKSKTIDVVITDYNLPNKDGLALFTDIKSLNPEIPVIFITAFGTIDRAVSVMKVGAFDYLTKPINIEELIVIIERACTHNALISENKRLRKELDEKYTVKGIVSASSKMQEVLNITSRVAPSKASVLIRGESGVGKEVVAKVIHYASPRKNAPFVAFNVAALSPTLIESELFGHQKGAFTGADRSREGRFVQAHTGTLFIDEIGDIPVELQTKFLRVLQENIVEPLGSSKPIPIDIRIIAATNKNLESIIKNGLFREDLYYRLNVITIYIPPLRERKEDILPLTDLFIKKYSSENKKDIKGLTRESFDSIMKYNFPGNVRELENMIERAVVFARNNYITLEDLPPNIFMPTTEEKKESEDSLDSQVEKLEKHLIISALQKAGGNQSQSARALKLSERKLRYKMKKYKI